MKTSQSSFVRAIASAAWLVGVLLAVATVPSGAEGSSSWQCPGYPEICQESCTFDVYGSPHFCSNGQCACPPGYDRLGSPGNFVCWPKSPAFIPASADGDTTTAECGVGSCTPSSSTPWGDVASNHTNKLFDLVAVHGTSPGGEALNPVWGTQFTDCGVHGNGNAADGNPARSWAACARSAYDFCAGVQDAPDIGQYDPPNCQPDQGCGPQVSCDIGGSCSNDDNLNCNTSLDCPSGACPPDYTSAWPYLDATTGCRIVAPGLDKPARIDFANNVSIYRAPIMWEDHSSAFFGFDDDYTWDMHSPGGELYDVRPPCIGGKCAGGIEDCSSDSDCMGRVHVEFDSDEATDHFSDSDVDDNPFGTASLWWTLLHDKVDARDTCLPGFSCDDDKINGSVCCWLRQQVSPGLDCNDSSNSGTCHALSGTAPSGIPIHDPLGVVVGVPSIDCGDHPRGHTSEIHPDYAMAIRIQETCASRDASGLCTQTRPEKWAFFYRNKGNNGGCGNTEYSSCRSTFQLPLGLPDAEPGYVITGAQVEVQWHAWAADDSPSSDITVDGYLNGQDHLVHFDPANGTVLTIHLPRPEDGVVGLVTVTPGYDATPPTITCPAGISQAVDLGKCTAAVAINPTISDNCLVSASCNPPSGSAFPIGTTAVTCSATDQAGLSSSPCGFNVTVTAGNKCPHDVGYWKKHTTWPVASLMLGTRLYGQPELLSILKSSTTGDASVILGSAEIATLLSLANGSNPTPICATVGDADAALGNLHIPGKISPKTVSGQRMVSDANSLTNYNSGILTPGCTP